METLKNTGARKFLFKTLTARSLSVYFFYINTMFHQAQYDEVQLKKRNSQSPLSATFPRDVINPTFLTQTSIPEETELLLNGKKEQMPETVV